MDKEIRRNIILIALDNLIFDYSNALEDKELNLGSEERELAINMVNLAKEVFLEESQEINNPITPRPLWKKT